MNREFYLSYKKKYYKRVRFDTETSCNIFFYSHSCTVRCIYTLILVFM